ncbi:dihydrofolate reductase family protein [Blastococcus sp. SYSU D00695]
MRRLTFGMNVSLDGYVAAPDGDLGWGAPSDELFSFWSDRVASTGTALYGRRLWEDMNAHWPTADRQPDPDVPRGRSPEPVRDPALSRDGGRGRVAWTPTRTPGGADAAGVLVDRGQRGGPRMALPYFAATAGRGVTV